MDLFANMLGLVVIGGAGLMVMVGGAVVHSQSGPAAFAKLCQGGRSLWRDHPDFMTTTPSRISKIDARTCSVELIHNDVRFVREAPSIGEGEGLIKRAVCGDIFKAAAFLENNSIKDGVIEIVGATSEEWGDRRKCQTQTAEDQAIAERCDGCPPRQRAAVRRRLNVVNTFQYDLALCNRPLAQRRADWVQRVCFDWAASDEKVSGLDPSSVTGRIYPTVKINNDPADCRGTAPECYRTVSVRLRLPGASRNQR